MTPDNLKLVLIFFFVPLALVAGAGRLNGTFGLLIFALVVLGALWFALLTVGLGGKDLGTVITGLIPLAGAVSGFLLARYPA